jgi:transcriptional regulator with GAF, ATPase, and Fis domain
MRDELRKDPPAAADGCLGVTSPHGDGAEGVTAEIELERDDGSWLVEAGNGAEPTARLLARGETLVIGSAPGSAIRIFDDAVSGRHCSLALSEGRVLVSDLGSTNGLYVGGARIEKASMAPGACFTVGRSVVSVRSEKKLLAGPAPSLPGVVGTSMALAEVMREVRRIAQVKGAVLLRGETGTGKDVFARAMHAIGPRRARPFIPLNVGTLPRELADAELFGHERGAYTGAHGAREGAFVLANGGTLFLDEIGELSPELQVKLLRVLEDGEVRPLGARTSRKVDVRIVSATWAPLSRRVAEGSFRQDLYQRLAVFVVDVPPLRERRADLPELSRHFLSEFKDEIGARELSPGALGALAAYGWPGNVRELRNVLYRAALRSPARLIAAQDVMESLSIASPRAKFTVSPEQAREMIVSHGGNVSAAARQLGVARSTLRGWVQQS